MKFTVKQIVHESTVFTIVCECVCVILRILVQICISQDSGSKILKSGLKDAFFSAWWQFFLCLLVCVFEERHPRSYYKSMIRHIPENNFVLHAWRSPHGLHICFWHFRSHLTFGCFFLILQRTNVPAVFLHEFCYHLLNNHKKYILRS